MLYKKLKEEKKKTFSQLVLQVFIASITDLQLVDTHLIYPSIPNPIPVDSPKILRLKPAYSDLVFLGAKSIISNISIDSAVESIKTNFSFFSSGT